MLDKLIDKIKWYTSLIFNTTIYKGTNLTIDIDESDMISGVARSMNGRRISHTTGKYVLRPEYSHYELIGVSKDPGSEDVIYTMISCFDDKIIKVKKDKFTEMFISTRS